MLNFTRSALQIFRSNPVLRRRSFFSGTFDGGGRKDVMWVRTDGEEMTEGDWSDPENRVLGMLIPGRATDERDERGRRIRGDTVLLLLRRRGSLARDPPDGESRPDTGDPSRGAESRRAFADAVAVRRRRTFV
jgi:glycogen operon protein